MMTHFETDAERLARLGEWRTIFAWYPMEIDNAFNFVWLEKIDRRLISDDGWEIVWEYRVRGKLTTRTRHLCTD